MVDASPESALDLLLASFGPRMSRRTLLKATLATGVAAAGTGLLESGAFAQTTTTDTPTEIFSVAATAERLAVTFYTNGVNNASALGLTGATLDAFKGFLIEEQIHELFFVSQGGTPIASTFSFPSGASTFTDLATFIKTQQTLEGAFDSAFIAAAYEFAQMNNPAVARISVMIAMIEEGHRTVGRLVGGLDPAEENAFAPQLVAKVSDAPAVLMSAGFLSPTAGNTYAYAQADFTSPALSPVFNQIMNQAPFAVSSTSVPTSATPYYGPAGGGRGRGGPIPD